MPLVPGRTFALSIPGAPTHGPLNWPGDNSTMTFMDELVTAEIGQVGTQLDGLAHPMIRIEGVQGVKDGNYFYNGIRLPGYRDSPRAQEERHPKTSDRLLHAWHADRHRRAEGRRPAARRATPSPWPTTRRRCRSRVSAMPSRATWCCSAPAGTSCGRTNHTGQAKRPDQIAANNNAEYGAGEPGVAPEVCDYLAERRSR